MSLELLDKTVMLGIVNMEQRKAEELALLELRTIKYKSAQFELKQLEIDLQIAEAQAKLDAYKKPATKRKRPTADAKSHVTSTTRAVLADIANSAVAAAVSAAGVTHVPARLIPPPSPTAHSPPEKKQRAAAPEEPAEEDKDMDAVNDMGSEPDDLPSLVNPPALEPSPAPSPQPAALSSPSTRPTPQPRYRTVSDQQNVIFTPWGHQPVKGGYTVAQAVESGMERDRLSAEMKRLKHGGMTRKDLCAILEIPVAHYDRWVKSDACMSLKRSGAINTLVKAFMENRKSIVLAPLTPASSSSSSAPVHIDLSSDSACSSLSATVE